MLRERISSESRETPFDLLPPAPTRFGMRLLQPIWQTLVERQGIIAYLPIIAAMILLTCGASWQFFAPITDVTRYQCYALTFWQGSAGTHLRPDIQCAFLGQFGVPAQGVLPFHIVPFEYPPLTLSIFSLVLVAPLPYYQIAFALLMACAALGIYWLLLRYGPRGAAFACAFYLVLGSWGTAEGRFDLVPAGLTLLCVIAAERQRWTLAYVALALGFLLKIYPLLLLPALFLAEQMATQHIRKPSDTLTLKTLPGELWNALREIGKWRWRNVLLFFSLILAVSGLFAILNFQGTVVSQLSYFAQRPVQAESTGSTLLWLASLIGHPVNVVYTFGSANIESDLGGVVSLVFELFSVLGYLVIILWQWRGKLDVVQAFIALILIFIVTGKVFSPQYLIWVIPLLAYHGAFSRRWLILWGTLCLLTTIIYPYIYMQTADTSLVPYIPGFVEFVGVRNTLLTLITLAFVFNWQGLNQRKIIHLLPSKA
ncbi:MAG TPA: hypothetical protein VFV38_51935 [Ktedonobacteraceae bacterium]|nr:hypothetical protein [Ktedonobacteraceae bacterium]